MYIYIIRTSDGRFFRSSRATKWVEKQTDASIYTKLSGLKTTIRYLERQVGLKDLKVLRFELPTPEEIIV